ncbi:hypothetical protein RJT34_31028 [Clitoria ternatea]|uniref:Uncharacterized protein n=1 Tax=Clitoria ternatea TaxID=43366 RepID=A0AAN9I0Z9_CLITE
MSSLSSLCLTKALFGLNLSLSDVAFIKATTIPLPASFRLMAPLIHPPKTTVTTTGLLLWEDLRKSIDDYLPSKEELDNDEEEDGDETENMERLQC